MFYDGKRKKWRDLVFAPEGNNQIDKMFFFI